MSDDAWYIYVDKQTLRVCKSSPALEEDDSAHVIKIERELGVSFVHSPHTINDYIVYFDGDKAHFLKKEKVNEAVAQFFYTPMLMKEGVTNPEITVKIKDEMMEVVLKKELISYATTLYTSVHPSKQFIEFYVSAKNDPNKLIEILKVNMLQVILSGSVSFPFKHDPNKVSLFTRKVFESYGLVIE